MTLNMSTSLNPQTDGSSEIINRKVENYLHCYFNYHQNVWDELLPSDELAYNSSFLKTLGCHHSKVIKDGTRNLRLMAIWT